MDYRLIDLDKVKGNPLNPRITKTDQYQRLVKDLEEGKKKGIIKSAIWVSKQEDGTFKIIDGHHRVRAMNEVGIKQTPAIIAEGYEEEEQLADMISMNEPVADLDALKMAEIIRILRDRGWTWERLETRLGYKRAELENYTQLLKFDFSQFTPTPMPDLNKLLITFSVPMTREQIEIVEQAITKIAEKEEGMSRGRALELIAADFLAGVPKSIEKG